MGDATKPLVHWPTAKLRLINANPSCRCSQDIIFLRGTSDNTFGSTTRILLALLTVQASRRATLRLGPNALDATIAQNCFYMWASQDVVIALFGSEKMSFDNILKNEE